MIFDMMKVRIDALMLHIVINGNAFHFILRSTLQVPDQCDMFHKVLLSQLDEISDTIHFKIYNVLSTLLIKVM